MLVAMALVTMKIEECPDCVYRYLVVSHVNDMWLGNTSFW